MLPSQILEQEIPSVRSELSAAPIWRQKLLNFKLQQQLSPANQMNFVPEFKNYWLQIIFGFTLTMIAMV